MSSSGKGRPAPGWASCGVEAGRVSANSITCKLKVYPFAFVLQVNAARIRITLVKTIRPKPRQFSPPTAPRRTSTDRRSPCPVACTLDLLGDRWTLLVVRDLMLGRSRFKDFTASPEGIPTNILSQRLARLTTHGITRQQPVSEGSKRLSYHLTEKGKALRPVVLAMRDWGLEWEENTEARLTAAPD